MEIHKYGLTWEVSVKGPRIRLANQGLSFISPFPVVSYHPFWGYYVDITCVQDIKGKHYLLPQPAIFYAEELSELPNATVSHPSDEEIYTKQDFEAYGNEYRMSLYSDTERAYCLLIEVPPKIQYITGTRKDYLSITKDVYDQLPNLWIMTDLYDINKEYYDKKKQLEESIWYEIAKYRAAGKPIKIPIELQDSEAVAIYTEQIKYNIALPIIQQRKTQYFEEIVRCR